MSKEQGSESAVSRSQSVKEEEMANEKEVPSRLSRKEFVKAAAVGGAGVGAVGAVGALASCAGAAGGVGSQGPAGPAGPAGPSGITEIEWDYETDVVVAGSGNGGMSAAIAAAKAGAAVIVVEISSTTGGGSSYSGGGIHARGLETLDDYMEYTCGLHDPELGPFYFERFQEYKKWLVEIGASVTLGYGAVTSPSYYANDLTMGQGEEPPLHCRAYFDSLEGILEDAGGTILLKTRGMKLLTDEEGTIVGLKAKGAEGLLNIKAKAVILSCGGFQNNPELRQKYLGREADMASILAVPYCTGDGMAMAQEVGAALRGSMGTFSALLGPPSPFHNVQEVPEEYEATPYTPEGKEALWRKCRIPVPTGAILVNAFGKRYIDEASTTYRMEQATIRQRQAKGILVMDKTMRDTMVPWRDYDPLEETAKAGGMVYEADTISELADMLASPPYATPLHKAAFVRTVEEYNQAVEAGKTEELDVPKTGGGAKIETPPFYAVPLTPWVYMCYGGVAINKNAQVLDRQKEPIPGLYATPPAAGGLFREIYTGAIGCAGTFGWIAGEHAAAL